MNAETLLLPEGDQALFLDVDGTLLEIAATPEAVQVSASLLQLLKDLEQRLGGALALVSGRSIHNLDELFAPLRLCASGIHGCERRNAHGELTRPAFDAHALNHARAELRALVAAHPGLLFEDKGFAVAVHYRLAPELAAQVLTAMQKTCEALGERFELQAGKRVFEIRPAGWSKGTAITEFMREAPFAGRTPVFAGDDLTDEHGFEVVNELGGLSIRVGGPVQTRARLRIGSVSEMHAWLRELIATTTAR